MSMDSFFLMLRQKVSFHQIDSDSDNSDISAPDTLGSDSQNNDELFVIEQTEECHTAVYDHGVPFSLQRYQDPPPTYRQVSESDGLPSYLSVISGSCTNISRPTMFSEVKCSSVKCKENFPAHNQRSTLSEVPFILHPILEMQHKVDAIFNGLDLEHDYFDWSKHSHDFKTESIYLQDMNSDSTFQSQCGKLPSGDTNAVIKP